jgi:hypothetical protein
MQLHKEPQVKICKDSSPWDRAIHDAERKLKHTEARTKRLRSAIENFKAHKQAGIPWPGDVAGTDKKQSVPA